jgi:quinol monooxygenase YgiN
MAAAVHVATYLEALPAARRDGAALIAQYARAAATDAGNLGVQALQESARADRFVIIESWRDQAAYGSHESADYTQAFREQFKAVQRAPIDARINRSFAVDALPRTAGPRAISVVTHVDVPGARREEAEALLLRLYAAIRKDPGNVRYDIYQQLEPRTNHFTVYAVWETQRDFEVSGSTPHGLQFRAALGPLLGALYDERIYRSVSAR